MKSVELKIKYVQSQSNYTGKINFLIIPSISLAFTKKDFYLDFSQVHARLIYNPTYEGHPGNSVK